MVAGSFRRRRDTVGDLDLLVKGTNGVQVGDRLVAYEHVIRAIQNPHVSIIAHPAGRLIGKREPYEIDMDRVTSAARDSGCALEINAEPERLDLDDLHAHMARNKGVKVAISTDAHAICALDYMRCGIDQARRAWLTAEDVLNTRPLAELRRLLKRSSFRAA